MFGGTQTYNDTRGANVIVGMENSEKFGGDCLALVHRYASYSLE